MNNEGGSEGKAMKIHRKSTLSSQCESIIPECVCEDSILIFCSRPRFIASLMPSLLVARSFKDISEHENIIHGGKGV